MTADELLALASKMTSPAQDGPNVPGSAAWWRGNGRELARGVLELVPQLLEATRVDLVGKQIAWTKP